MDRGTMLMLEGSMNVWMSLESVTTCAFTWELQLLSTKEKEGDMAVYAYVLQESW